MKKLRVAVIGLGKQALEDHIPALLACVDCELIAVVDIDKEKVKFFLDSHQHVHGYADLQLLIDSEKLDFAIVATPHYTHFDITKFLIENHINVLKEKPFATSLSEGEMIKKLADQNSVEVSTTLQRRFNPIYSTFFQLVSKIGDVFYFDIHYNFFTDSPDVGWRAKNDLAGGVIVDMGYHVIDLLVWYFGVPEEIFAHTSCNAKESTCYDAEDTALLTVTYKKERFWGTVVISRVMSPKRESIDVYGTRGHIHLERGKIERFSSEGKLVESLSREQGWPSAAQDQIEYFVKVISGKKENMCGPEYELNHLRIIAAAYDSIKSNTVIKIKGTN